MSTAPAVWDFDGSDDNHHPVRRGDSFSHAFTFVDDQGAAIDKSSSTVTAQIRDLPGDLGVVFEFDVTVTGAANNVVTIRATPVETAQLAPGDYGWDLQEDDGTDTVTRLAGRVTVVQDYTRP